ncbi:MAG: molecular chaperone DnaJ [Alphaproteobacteria bacterium]|nr:MAG: molecular chaperone DnaJ [Alphaproteobacteria bacterium]
MSRSSPDALNGPFRRPEPTHRRRCEAPGCAEAGEYRAPASRAELNRYRWFCLEHVREYNRSWDYFAGMSEEEIERIRRSDTVWQRPSWPFGRFGECARHPNARIRDSFGFFSEDEPHRRQPARAMSEEEKALAVLDLEQPVTFEDVRRRYKTLVKLLHPDANGGDRSAEERLKEVNLAYATLKVSLS